MGSYNLNQKNNSWLIKEIPRSLSWDDGKKEVVITRLALKTEGSSWVLVIPRKSCRNPIIRSILNTSWIFHDHPQFESKDAPFTNQKRIITHFNKRVGNNTLRFEI
jgi:hypothetical protein